MLSTMPLVSRSVVCLLPAMVFMFAVGASASAVETAQRNPQADLAQEILAATDTTGGLIVHLGCGEGKLTAALGNGDSFLVQGLDTDPVKVRAAREHIGSLGIYGRVSIGQFDGRRLPYVGNLVNLLVAENLGKVTVQEAMQVLAPGGSLYEKQNGRWARTVKPWPENTDEWTHYLHDASGNPVAHDELVGPPGHFQWIAQPRHTRSHEYIPSIYAVVSSAGRIFYIIDETPVASIRQTPQWKLVARDAFNGTLLWKRSIQRWFPHIVNWGQTPRQLQRKLVAVGSRVYVTLGLHSPLCQIDAATGKTLQVYEDTLGTEEIILHQGILLLAIGSVTNERRAELVTWDKLVAEDGSPAYKRESAAPLVKRLRAAEAKGTKTLLALDADAGRVLWKKTGADVSGLRVNSLCALGDRVFLQNGGDVVCRDLRSGKLQWTTSASVLRAVHDDGVYCANGKTVTALETETGKTRWSEDASLVEIRDLFVAGGSLWLGGFKPCPGKRGPVWGPYFATERDLATGEILARVEPDNPSHHHRCYSNKATDRFILAGRRGVEFIDLESGEHQWNSWVRGVCKYGIMPCNGLLYAPPHACGCYISAKLTGFNALSARKPSDPAEQESQAKEQLLRGPAYSETAPTSAENASDWPTYRHDAQRSGGTRSGISAKLHPLWTARLGGKLTPPTIAQATVFVAAPDEHRIMAINADSGKPVWHFTAGARVDSPPTLDRGQAIFGCRDGSVYSVRTSDGALAWRLQTAGAKRQIAVNGQLESALPVPGSVLVQDGVASFTAGRSSYLDGGIDLYRVEAQSGKTLSKTKIYSPDPQTGKQPDQSGPAAMPGALMDILSGDDRHVYLRDMTFDRHGEEQSAGLPHLLTLTGFLDDNWAHRSYWIFGTHCSISTGCSGRARDLVFGRLLAFDDTTVYGYGRRSVHWSNEFQDGAYRVFAAERDKDGLAWEEPLPLQPRAMLLADKVLFVAGFPPNKTGWASERDNDPTGLLMAVSTSDGEVLAQYTLDSPPIFDGLAAADGRLYVSLQNGSLVCMGEAVDNAK